MYLKNISLINFKNYASAELDFCSGINCFTGVNGEGKTNLLDAIHYLSFCKSFFNPIDSQNILHEAPFFMIQGTFEVEGTNEEIYCGQKRSQKKQFKRNKSEYNRLADHIGLFPLVMISPADTDLINEGSESRRKFLDSVIAQFDRVYLEDLISYNKILSQRNALLKRFAETGRFVKDSLEVWDLQMVDFAKRINKKRKGLVDELIPIFQRYYEMLSGGREQVQIIYHSDLNYEDFDVVLKAALVKDRAFQYSTVGVHKDDLELKLNGYPVKKYGSQGQQKSYLIAMKLAQYDYIKKIKNVDPLLLLDDIHDKLDEARVKQLMELVSSEHFGQIFITDTHSDRISGILSANTKIPFRQFNIKGGIVESRLENISILTNDQ
ncbi:MAG: DNA replication/repair protein RecF [Bacteroidia bacterium]|nr:DNA replication/repair protein RecF [Bacteroidia bacterium]